MSKAKVYFTTDLTPRGLVRIYDALGVKLKGKVGVKISTGEAGGNNYLKPELIGDLVKKLDGTIIECNTAYPGKRNTAKDHLEVAREHGFFDVAEVDIMDEDGEFEIPVEGGRVMETDIVGVGLKKYDSVLNLAHFKGHAMGGFGGALKNQSIGFASRHGKALIHSGGKTKNALLTWTMLAKQLDFLGAMAETAKAVQDYFGGQSNPETGEGRILYIDVMNNLSVDCDCDANPEEPCMKDIGILGSVNPVALDQACIDKIWSSTDVGRDHFIERVERQQGREILGFAEALGMGSREYELIQI